MINNLRIILTSILVIVAIGLFGQNKKKGLKLESEYDTASYMLGVYFATSFKDLPAKNNMNIKLIQRGLTDNLEDTPQFTMEEVQTFMNQFMKNQQTLADEEAKSEGIKAEKEFLDANRKKEGIHETESGLQYRIIKEGTGISPAETDKVEVHYTGKLLDGTVFDSSVERGESIEFGLNQVIKGWTEGVQLMKEGAVYEFYIPYDLAYGSRSAGNLIKPYSTLVFEIELIKVIE